MRFSFDGTTHDLCRILQCVCERRIVAASVKLKLGAVTLTFIGRNYTMQVSDSGGPFTATISNFVDAKGNPVTDTDVPVWASSDPTIATVVVDPTNPQSAVYTLTGKLGQTQATATFGDPAAGGFVVTGSLEVVAGAAVSATMTFTGTGIAAPTGATGPQ